MDNKYADEEWVYLFGEEKYIISNYGRIWSNCVNRILKMQTHNFGYIQVTLGAKRYLVHRLVYEHFIGKIPDGFVIDHIDRTPGNNYVKNLRAVTQKENNDNQGERDFGHIIRTNVRTGERVMFYSVEDALIHTPLTKRAGINYVCRGQFKTHAGYKWEREESFITKYDHSDDYVNMGMYKGVDYSNYEVSPRGFVRNAKTHRLLRINYGEYGRITIDYNKITIHRLIADKFCKREDISKDQVNHRNGNKRDNSAGNLEWVTGKENMAHSHGIKIKSIDLSTNEEKIFTSAREASRSISDKDKHGNIINACKSGKPYHNKIWEFIED